MQAPSLILNHEQIVQKVRRIAVEIFERNFLEADLVIAGVWHEGYTFATMLAQEFEAVSGRPVRLVKVQVDKTARQQPDIQLDIPLAELEDRVVVLADDVINSGRTMLYALEPFTQVALKKLQVAVIVDRTHRTFPVKADYVGYSLSTTIQEHVRVSLSEAEPFQAYLM